MRKAACLVVTLLLVACGSSSSDSSPELTGFWIVAATPTATSTCNFPDQWGFWSEALQTSSDAFWIQGEWFGASGVLDGNHATFSYDDGEGCLMEVSADVSGSHLSGTMTYTCSGGSPCETDLTLAGARDLSAQALCDQARACGGISNLSQYEDCIQQTSSQYVFGMDASPSRSAACINAIPVEPGDCSALSEAAFEDCLDFETGSWTCLDETTLRVFGHGTHRDVDCNVVCYAYLGAAGSCSTNECICLE